MVIFMREIYFNLFEINFYKIISNKFVIKNFMCPEWKPERRRHVGAPQREKEVIKCVEKKGKGFKKENRL